MSAGPTLGSRARGWRCSLAFGLVLTCPATRDPPCSLAHEPSPGRCWVTLPVVVGRCRAGRGVMHVRATADHRSRGLDVRGCIDRSCRIGPRRNRCRRNRCRRHAGPDRDRVVRAAAEPGGNLCGHPARAGHGDERVHVQRRRLPARPPRSAGPECRRRVRAGCAGNDRGGVRDRAVPGRPGEQHRLPGLRQRAPATTSARRHTRSVPGSRWRSPLTSRGGSAATTRAGLRSTRRTRAPARSTM